LISSFGSGAGSDSFSFIISDKIKQAVSLAPLTRHYIDRSILIDYAKYARWRKKILK